MRKPPKRKAFKASKEVKRRARAEIGAPPASRAHESSKRKPPKHKKPIQEDALQD